jgi:hypothetical protein
VPRGGRLASTGDLGEPYRLIDAEGAVVEPVAAFLRELLAAGRSPATLRSYGMDLLRWWRFLGAVDVDWRPAAAGAFVWLRLYQEDLRAKVPRGRTRPLWWTLRRPHRPLTYHAAHRMFERANACLGSDWTLHDLRDSAATRMARDPQTTLSDVQVGDGPRPLDHHRVVFDAHQRGVAGHCRCR